MVTAEQVWGINPTAAEETTAEVSALFSIKLQALVSGGAPTISKDQGQKSPVCLFKPAVHNSPV